MFLVNLTTADTVGIGASVIALVAFGIFLYRRKKNKNDDE
ncbi:LPXTG cell wall anchor domain-containing protein [Erysipelothrix sp. HDW6B]|nr:MULTISPECIES: LPXTG cell wall anchor domain-containing protein [Erysipelothrix]QIK86375.1 LPXTG cell wall anchor domain-containing protein [Erysipelothrix sp. HDW6B]